MLVLRRTWIGDTLENFNKIEPRCAPQGQCDIIAKKMTDVFSETEHPVFLHGKELCKWFTARTSVDFAAEEDHNTMMATKFVMSCRQLSNLATAKIFARKHTDIPSRSDDEGNPRGYITQCSARHTGAGRPSSRKS